MTLTRHAPPGRRRYTVAAPNEIQLRKERDEGDARPHDSAARFSFRRVALALEGLVLFGVLPVCLAFRIIPVPDFIGYGMLGLAWTPIILAAAALSLAYLLLDKRFDRRQLWDTRPARLRVRFMIPCAAVLGAGYGALLLVVEPDALFWLITYSPNAWVIAVLAYPVVSVIPQEIVYRTFFFHRYASLFSSRLAVGAFSALAFCVMHSVFMNGTALLIGAVGGVLFAYTYAKTRSAPTVILEHILYGWVMFTVAG